MISRLSLAAVPALFLLAACEEGGVMGSGTNTGIGANDINTVATTPEGQLQTALNAPGQVSTCEDLAIRIERSDVTEVERQAAIEERQRIGC
jgi:hypothetical protein